MTEPLATIECYIPKGASELLVRGRLARYFQEMGDNALTFWGLWRRLRGKRVRITVEIIGEGERR